ncbi:MAG: hypothetical protein ACREL7_06050 [Longimicrobiales bacterium]
MTEPQRDDGVPMLRAVRSLAGIARLAEQPRLHDAAAIFAAALRQNEARQDATRLRETVADLHAILRAAESESALDGRLAALKARWSADAGAMGGAESADASAFLGWVGEEAIEIAATMERGVQAFIENPHDREWLGAILRRQRSLLGAASLPDVPMVAETLHAVEDLAEMIVRLDVPIKMEWLDVFRFARDVLRSAAENLARGEQPDQINALSRLRTLRTELHDRYGARVASPPKNAPVVHASGDDHVLVFPIGAQESAAETRSPLERALTLRPAIEAGADRASRSAVAELYALLREALE